VGTESTVQAQNLQIKPCSGCLGRTPGEITSIADVSSGGALSSRSTVQTAQYSEDLSFDFVDALIQLLLACHKQDGQKKIYYDEEAALLTTSEVPLPPLPIDSLESILCVSSVQISDMPNHRTELYTGQFR